MVRGEVFRLRPGRAAQGREQRGERFGVIVQADELLVLSTALLAPTSTRARPATFRPQVELDGTLTRVLADQTRAVDLRRLGSSVGRLDAREQRAVDDALLLVLGLR